MAGKSQSPYRAPCFGWTQQPKKHLGGCGQSHYVSEDVDPKFGNYTLVADFLLDGGGDPIHPGGIPPYPRHNHHNGGASCPPFGIPAGCRPGNPCFDPVPGNTAEKCCPWPEAERGELNPPGVIIDHNCYRAVPGQVVDMRLCRKIGFKSVQARKSWHGRFGFNSPDNSPGGGDVNGYPMFCGLVCDCSFVFPHSAPDQVKFLNLGAEIRIEMFDGSEAEIERAIGVNRFSGVQTLTDCSDSSSGPSAATALTQAKLQLPQVQNASLGTLVSMFCDVAWIISTWPTAVFTGSVTGGSGSYEATVDFGPGVGVLKVAEGNISLGMGAANRKGWDASGAMVLDEVISIGPTNYQWSRSTPVNGFFDALYSLQTAFGTLGSPYSNADVLAEVYALLATWDLSDDKQHQWRNDALLAIGPTVYYREPASNVTPTLPADCSFVDSNADLYDGELVGAPLPAGYGPHFNWDYVEYAECGLGSGEYYQLKWGDTSLGATVPLRSTRWTEAVTLNSVGAGAFLRHKPNGPLFAQKWAETIERRPSQNFFRPAADDRYAIDPEKNACVLTFSGGDEPLPGDSITLFTPIASIPTGTHCYYGGKAWSVTRIADDAYTLTTQLAVIPVGLRPPEDLFPFGVFGALRWPSAWPIGGAVRVLSSSESAGVITITFQSETDEGDATLLRDGDIIEFTNEAGGTTEGPFTITVVNDHTLTYSDSDVPTGVLMKSSGAPHRAYWDDQVKGDYVILGWDHNHRDYVRDDGACCRRSASCFCDLYDPGNCVDLGGGACDDSGEVGWASTRRRNQAIHGMPRSVSNFTVTPACKRESPCGPSCHAITPNGENMRNGNRTPFPSSFTMDEQFGATWQAGIEQSVPDPLAMTSELDEPFSSAPPDRCDGCAWVEDDGECTSADGSGLCYYAHRPYVEARATLPSGAPAMPANTRFGYYTLAELDTPTITGEKHVAIPPTISEGPFNVATTEYLEAAWIIYQKQETCVCNDGRFADNYRANFVSCPNEA